MAGAPDSWEDDPSIQDDRLANQTQNLNLRAQANSFQPTAPAFNPQQYQYGGNYNQQYYGYQGQYGNLQGQPGYGWDHTQTNPYNQQYQYGQGRQQWQNPHPAPTNQPVTIAQRNAAPASTRNSEVAPPQSEEQSNSSTVPATNQTVPQAKSKTAEDSASAATPQKPKILSISSTAPTPKNDTPKPKDEPKEGTAATETNNTLSQPNAAEKAPKTQSLDSQSKQKADNVAKEQAQAVDEETLEQVYGDVKEHLNIIFLGHVDAGKSTLGGSILVSLGCVDERTLEKYKKEAKEAGRETWWLSWVLDLTSEERSKGKTVEVGRGSFTTDKRRYSILDAPGHKSYVPNMVGSASQADLGILVISARKGEFESGFERGGQTREHAILARNQGVQQLVVVVNKLDTVDWSSARYKECTEKLKVFLKSLGYTDSNVVFIPVSAQTLLNIKDRIPKSVCPWYDGPSLLEYCDNLELKSFGRKINAPLIIPITSKSKDMGTIVEGKVESGVLKKGGSYVLQPNGDTISVLAVYVESDDETPQAIAGELARIKIRGAEEDDIPLGSVLCSSKSPVHRVTQFEAQIVLLQIKSILSAGFSCMLHVHAAAEEITFEALLHKLEKGTGRKSKRAPEFATKGMSIIARLKVEGARSICMEKYDEMPIMGRFTLRDQGETIGIGKVIKLLD